MFGATRVEQGLSPEQKLANAQTQHTQRVQSNARSIEQAHSIIRDVKNGHLHNQEYQGAKDQLTAGLEQRKDLVLIQAEAQRLAEAGDLRTATALLSGEMSLDQLDQTRLKASNPNATKITGPNGQELSDQEVVTQERTALQETINQNRIAIAQLTARTQKFDQEIGKREQANLSTDKKSQIAMEQRTLLAAEQERLERETQRLFQRHDAVTKALNEGDLGRARDILEGRQAVLEPGQKAESKQSGEELASRNFVRTQEEEQKYQASQTALQEVQEQEAQHAVLETGVKTNLTETKKDIKKNSGWLASWGGHIDALKETARSEATRLENFEQQRATIDRAKTQAQTLIAQGKYDEATELLRKTKDLASKDFKESNSELQESYKAVNEDLAKFDQKLKDSAVEVSKQVAVGVVAASAAAALAPATGGMSLAAFGTMIGGGSLAGFAAGTAIDVVNAGVDMSVFGDDSKTAFGKALSKAGSNAQTALIGALGGAAAGGIMTKLAELGKGTTLASLGAAGGASATTSTADVFVRRVVAERDWTKQGGGTAEEKEAFMKANGVDAASLGKSWLTQTGGGIAGGLLGIRTSAAKEAGRSALRESSRELAESTGEALIGLAAAYAEHGEFTPDTVAGALMDVAVGSKMAKMTQNHFETRAQRNRSNIPDDTRVQSSAARIKQRTGSEPVVKVNPELEAQGVQARTTVSETIDPATGEKRKQVQIEFANQELADGKTTEAQKVWLEETTHGLEKTLVDPKLKDGTTMSQAEYEARRVAQEFLVRAGAEGKAAGSSSNPEQRRNSELYREARRAIDSGDFAAVKTLAENNGIGQADWNNYKNDYEHNTKPDRAELKQTSNSGKKGLHPSEQGSTLVKPGTITVIPANGEHSLPTLLVNGREIPIKLITDNEGNSLTPGNTPPTPSPAVQKNLEQRLKALAERNFFAQNGGKDNGLIHGHLRHGAWELDMHGRGKNPRNNPADKFASDLSLNEYQQLIQQGMTNIDHIEILVKANDDPSKPPHTDIRIIGRIPSDMTFTDGAGNQVTKPLGTDRIEIRFSSPNEQKPFTSAVPLEPNDRTLSGPAQLRWAKPRENGTYEPIERGTKESEFLPDGSPTQDVREETLREQGFELVIIDKYGRRLK